MPFRMPIPPAMKTQWQCPNCDSKELEVKAGDWYGLHQTQVNNGDRPLDPVGNYYRILNPDSHDMLHFEDDMIMRCRICQHKALGFEFEWQTGPEGTISVRVEREVVK
jgi:hypothetical protein